MMRQETKNWLWAMFYGFLASYAMLMGLAIGEHSELDDAGLWFSCIVVSIPFTFFLGQMLYVSVWRDKNSLDEDTAK